MESQLQILSESLDKKLEVLREIQEYNIQQEKAFSADEVDMGSFDEAIAEKERLIEKVTALDSGFEMLYEKLAQELEGNRERYQTQIKTLQEKISKVMEMSVAVQAQEARNKKLIEQYFGKERQNLQQSRRHSAAAYQYYRNLNAAGTAEPRFMDRKK